MDIQRILRLARKTGDKCIIIENDEPAYVIVTFDEYERMITGGPSFKTQTNITNTSIESFQPKSMSPHPVQLISPIPQNKPGAKIPEAQQPANKPKVIQKLNERQGNLNEEELLEKINKDIASYRQQMIDNNAQMGRPNSAKTYYTEPPTRKSA